MENIQFLKDTDVALLSMNAKNILFAFKNFNICAPYYQHNHTLILYLFVLELSQ